MVIETWTGGCQCGAVRYAFSARPDNPYGDTAERFEKIRASNRQHPDHDTDNWSPM